MFATRSDKKEKYYKSWRIVFAFFAAVLGGVVCGLCSMYFATSSFSIEMFFSYFSNPYITVFNLVPPVLLSAIFYLIFNRAVWSYVATNALVMIPTLINYYKIALRGDCFIAEDMALADEASQMLSSYDLFIDKRVAVYIAIFVIGTVLLAVFARGRSRRTVSRYICAAVLVAASVLLAPFYTSDNI